MKKAIIPFLLLVFPSYAQAAFTDFEGLTHLSRYFHSETISSDGLIFEAVDLALSPGGVRAIDGEIFDPGSENNRAGGTGVYLSFARLGLGFPLPPDTQHVSFLFGEFTSQSGAIIVNGELAHPANGLRQLDGTTLGGVSISVTNIAGHTGELRLNGPLQSLVVGGTEFALDNVTIGIPEPSTAALLLAAGVSLLTTRRRRA